MGNQNELIQRPNWWKRNWKWAVPVGGCLTIIIVGIIVIAGVGFTAFNKIKTQTGSDQALIDAQNNTEVVQYLGEPIESDGIGNFNISIKNGSQTANSTVPIKGPKGEGTIHISVLGKDDDKEFLAYNVTIAGSDVVIDLEKPEN